MKIKISKIDESAYNVREKYNPDYINELTQSLKEDGQWSPIIVRSVGEEYKLIAGHNRIKAAKELGWDEIEAVVKDINDEEALFLSLKTNLVRQDLSEREQGKVLHELTQIYKISQRELARRLGKDDSWVQKRIKLALNLDKNIASALDKGIISMTTAGVIASLDLPQQEAFLKYILINKIQNDEEAVRKAKKRILNNTIYTIGYEGKNIKQFIEVLKKNDIKQLIDVRYSTESQFKPEFSKSYLSRELELAKIKYIHKHEFGVPFEWQEPYKARVIPLECFEKYYRWRIKKQQDEFNKLIDEIKENGKTALMCLEKHAKPLNDQKIACHRNILANILLETLEFQERVDL